MKKNLLVIPLLVLLCFIISCQDKAAKAELEKFKAQAALEEQNKALVTRFYEAFAKGDTEAIKGMCSSDLLKGLLDSMKGNKESFTDIAFIPQDMIAKGNKVATRYIAKGSAKAVAKEGEPAIAEGKKIEIALYTIERIENGKIVESWELQDNLSLYEQFGYELKPKEEKKK